MTKHFNKKSEKEKRRFLRKNQTAPEKLIWLYIRRRQIEGKRFLRQFSVDHFVIDFYCPELKLGIEIDGDSHFESKDAIEYDRDRENYLMNFNIELIRFTNEEVITNPEKVLNKITQKVKGNE